MKINAAGLLLCTFLAGCGGGSAPFGEDATTDGDSSSSDGGGDGSGISRDGVPPGTTSPTPDTTIFRSEPTEADGGKPGDGFAQGISYDGDTDTFTVDNLAFDGGNVYQRGTAVSSFGDYAVYEADAVYPDSLNGQQINQLTHRAIYGVSRNTNAEGVPNTQFAIVRTGAYIPYGFGGFIYQRENNVSLPETGQAIFRGQTAGMRDFNGKADLQYTTGNLELAIDFEDFNNVTGARGDGVKGTLSNRKVFDINGVDITSQIVSGLNSNGDASLATLPDARATIGPGVLDDNGDLVGEFNSNYVDDEGQVRTYEQGKYYAIVAGEDPNEIVGVLVLENSLDLDGVTARETSGFIVYRDPAPTP
jgi:hypothetical protein